MRTWILLLICLFASIIGPATLQDSLDESEWYERELVEKEKIDFKWDVFFNKLKQHFLEHGPGNRQLPDFHRTLVFTDFLGKKWVGQLNLTNGLAAGLTEFEKIGNVLMDSANKTMEIKAILKFKTVGLSYDFAAFIKKLGFRGHFNGFVKDMTVNIVLLADLEIRKLTLFDFQISNVGTLSVHLSGTALGFIINAITQAITSLFHDKVVNVLEKDIRLILAQCISELDLDEIIGGCTTPTPPHATSAWPPN